MSERPSSRIAPLPAEVTIIRAGYASETLWFGAIQQARAKGRTVRAINREGTVRIVTPPAASARDTTRAPEGPRQPSA